jgi:hypothetical protein
MARAYTTTDSFPESYFRPLNPFDFLYPSYNCPHDLERVGQPGDGGKWVCGMSTFEAKSKSWRRKNGSKEACIVYSFGVKDDSSFEKAFLDRTACEIWGFDPYVTSWGPPLNQSLFINSQDAGRAHFTPVGVGGVSEVRNSRAFHSLQQLMAENDHEYIDIVKMDIEGAEFQTLSSLLDTHAKSDLPFGQLIVEVHLIPKDLFPDMVDRLEIPSSLSAWLHFWEALEEKGLRVVSSEPNPIGIMGVGRGQPRFAEVSKESRKN